MRPEAEQATPGRRSRDGIKIDGRHGGTLVDPAAAFDPTSREGEVGLLGTPPHAA
jgi:hypothetical protein